nr:hypothetical protein CFP56_62796 [Quercus suber]
MTTRFSKQKLAEAQEKKAKGGLVSGLLLKKRSKVGDVSKDDQVVTPPSAHSLAKRPCSHTSSLEVIALGVFLQALGESLFVSGKLLDLEKKVATSEPMVKSLFAENEMLKNKVAILTVKAENNKKRVAVLEKSLQVEKDFCKVKDKQISDLKLKLKKVGATVLQEFKDSNEYSDELCGYYVDGFDLLRKWMAKHHPDLDLSSLVIGDFEKELLSDRPSKATTKNVMEEAITMAEVTKEAATITPVNPVPDEQ